MYIRKLMAALAALLILTACNEKEEDNVTRVADSDYEVRVASYDKFGQLSLSFVQGEEITMVLSIKNVSSSTKTLTFSNSQQYDFFLVKRSNNTEQWRWSNDKVFSQVVTSYELAPGETKTFTQVWNQQVAEDGTVIAMGDYLLGADRFGVTAWPLQMLTIQ